MYTTLFSSFIEIKGWYSHHPGHSCKDIRDSGDSKEDGEYWIDPEKSGNPLKVFCDMTTDRGKLRMVNKEIFLHIKITQTLIYLEQVRLKHFLLYFASL